MAGKPKPSETLGMPKSTSPAGRKRPSDHLPGQGPAGPKPAGRPPEKPADGEEK